MHASLGFTLKGNAGTGNLCKSIDIVSFDSQALFDIMAHFLGPGFCPENTRLQFIVIRAVSLLCQALSYIGGIGRCAAKNRRIHIHHKLDLTVCIP